MVRSSLLPIAMIRHFNTAGPCKPELHYMLSPFDRIPEVRGLMAIEERTTVERRGSPGGREIVVIRG
ncbi:MAG: hypothetical protein HC860_25245 [Alkalinema sp. RU_4_3]|nr:hypothetical protein [Alkalinema sp. RU_4_3]